MSEMTLAPAFTPNIDQETKQTELSPIQLNDEAPLYRLQSSLCIDPELNLLFLFGGFDQDDIIDDQIYIMDLTKNKWLPPRRSGIFREGHSCTCLSRGKVLIYGGLPVDDVFQQNTTSNLKNSLFKNSQILVYDILEDSWSIPFQHPTTLNQPGSISRHSICMSTDKSKVYISGGYNNSIKEEPIDELFCFDFKSGKWDKRKFVSRFDHFIYESDNKIWSFGGLSKQMNHVKKISTFDLENSVIGELRLSNMPKLLTGNHFYLKISKYMILDIFTSQWSLDQETVKPSIGLFDLQTLKYVPLIYGNFQLLVNYRWKHFFIYNDHLCMLGYPLTPETNDTSFDYKLSHMIKISLPNLGVSTKAADNTDNGMILKQFYNMFKEDEFTDFQIVAVNSTSRPADGEEFERSAPIKVHKLILMTRWPYFKRLYQSGMTESQTNELFIPEPYGCVLKLLEFFYTNSVESCSIDELTGLILLSELYDLLDLKSIALNRVYSDGFRMNNILKVWEVSLFLEDSILRYNCESVIFENWGKLVKTKQFKNMRKINILKLFERLNDDSRILIASDDSSRQQSPQKKIKLNSDGQSEESFTRYGTPVSVRAGLFGPSTPFIGLQQESLFYQNYDYQSPLPYVNNESVEEEYEEEVEEDEELDNNTSLTQLGGGMNDEMQD